MHHQTGRSSRDGHSGANGSSAEPPDDCEAYNEEGNLVDEPKGAMRVPARLRTTHWVNGHRRKALLGAIAVLDGACVDGADQRPVSMTDGDRQSAGRRPRVNRAAGQGGSQPRGLRGLPVEAEVERQSTGERMDMGLATLWQGARGKQLELQSQGVEATTT